MACQPQYTLLIVSLAHGHIDTTMVHEPLSSLTAVKDDEVFNLNNS